MHPIQQYVKPSLGTYHTFGETAIQKRKESYEYEVYLHNGLSGNESTHNLIDICV